MFLQRKAMPGLKSHLTSFSLEAEQPSVSCLIKASATSSRIYVFILDIYLMSFSCRAFLNVDWFFLTVAAAQAIAEERRSQSGISPLAVQTSIKTATKPGIITGHCS